MSFDKNLKRVVYHCVNLSVSVPNFRESMTIPLLQKYNADFKRIKHGLNFCISQAMKDMTSRRLMTFNVKSYQNTFQCFNSFHFVFDETSAKYTLIVYQRSQDMIKWLDDIRFFTHVVEYFEKGTGYQVGKITVHYGDIHVEESGYKHLESKGQ